MNQHTTLNKQYSHNDQSKGIPELGLALAWRFPAVPFLLVTTAAIWTIGGMPYAIASCFIILVTSAVVVAQTQVTFFDVLSFRSSDRRRLGKVKRETGALCRAHGFRRSHVKQEAPALVSVEIVGERAKCEGISDSLGARCGALEVRRVSRGLSLDRTGFHLLFETNSGRETREFSPGDFSRVDGLTLGFDEVGSPVQVKTTDLRSLLISGLSGSGKSVVGALLVQCLVEGFEVKAIDLKSGLELSHFEHDRVSLSTTATGGLSALVQVRDEMERRLERLARQRKRAVEVDENTRAVVIVIDEVQELLSPSSLSGTDLREHSRRAGQVLGDILNRGRAAGIRVVAATQRPSSATIPTEIRDRFEARLAFYQPTVDGWKMALGNSFPEVTSMIPPGSAGAGVYLGPGSEVPRRLQTFWMSDSAVRQIMSEVSE